MCAILLKSFGMYVLLKYFSTVASGNVKAKQQTLRMIQGSTGTKSAVYKNKPNNKTKNATKKPTPPAQNQPQQTQMKTVVFMVENGGEYLCHRTPVWGLVSHLEMFTDSVFSFLGCTNLLVLCSLGMNDAHTWAFSGFHFFLCFKHRKRASMLYSEKQSLEESQTGRSAWTGACSL